MQLKLNNISESYFNSFVLEMEISKETFEEILTKDPFKLV